MRSCRSIGTATTERQPASWRICRCGSSRVAPRSGTTIGVRARAARPTSVPSSSMRISRSLRTTAASVLCTLRTRKQCSGSSYSMIEPPSVAESRTACMAMVESTWSTSRLELTASPTSPRASSWSTRRASSWPLASSCCTSFTPLTAIAAWRAKADTIALSRSSNGRTSLRHRLMAPTTCPSRSIGAAITVRYPASRCNVCSR